LSTIWQTYNKKSKGLLFYETQCVLAAAFIEVSTKSS